MIKNRDFILLLIGRFITNFGDSIYTIGAMMLVYSMTGSTLYTGIALFLTASMGIFQLLLSPILDRINIRRFLITSQLLQGLLLLVIPVLEYYGKLGVYHILILMPIISLINQMVYPCQISLLPRILKSDELIKGNSLFAIAYQGTDAIFNGIGGLALVYFGIISGYYINSVTFIINGILFIFLSKILNEKLIKDKIETTDMVKIHLHELREGLSLWKDDLLLPLLIGVIVINLAGTGIFSVLPAFSKDEFYYGLLISGSGIGIFLGSIVANMGIFQKISLGKFYIIGILTTGICWIAMTFTDSNIAGKSLSFILFIIGWVFVGILNIYSQTIIQTIIPREKTASAIGGMMGISVALSPIGALLGGLLGNNMEISKVIAIFGAIIVSVSIYWMFQSNIRKMDSMVEFQKGNI